MTITLLKMLAATLLIDLVVVLVYLAERKNLWRQGTSWPKQIIIGVIFGGLAIMGTEFGIPVEGATINVRDAAPLCAGLIFGGPAGIIAGCIGGIERWFSVYWGVGETTRLACSLATILAGVSGALLRRYMFDNQRPSWFYGLAVGLVAEVLHMLLVFLTNMSNVHTAFTIVQKCALLMISFNGLAVMLGVMLVGWLSQDQKLASPKHRDLAYIFQKGLLICVTVAFIFTCIFTFILQTRLSQSETADLLRLNIDDVQNAIQNASDSNLLNLTRQVGAEINALGGEVDHQDLMEIAYQYQVLEIDIISQEGIITACTNENFVGYNMADGEQSREFLVLLNGEQEYVQSYQPISYEPSIWRKYAGVALEGGGFVQVGANVETIQQDINPQVTYAAQNRHVGESGSVIVYKQDGTVINKKAGYQGDILPSTGLILPTVSVDQCFTAEIYGQKSLCMYAVLEGYYVIAALPLEEAFFSRDVSVYVMAFMEIILFAALFALVYFLIKILVVDNINKINKSLGLITGGNLEVMVEVRSSTEFSSLSNDINSTVTTLKRYIAEAAARIDEELEFARAIQRSALPSVFPPYPDRQEFEIYAMMQAAKEVGGDFYDFYLVRREKLVFIIADVSGKGIPAAMFMMTSKTLIKSLAEAGASVDEVFTQANNQLCENNEAGMFITAWLGMLDLKTGLLTFANAGHNPPLVKHPDGSFEYFKSRPNLVLAGMEGIKYRQQELQMAPGEVLFLYTDGVVEATDAEDNLYGEERLQTVLNAHQEADMEQLTVLVKADVDQFVGEAPQFDDITMLTLKYKGGSE